MVSQLSARLLSGYSSGNSSCGGGSVGPFSHTTRQAAATSTTTAATSATTRSLPTTTAGEGGASSTGYSADREGGNHRLLPSNSAVFLPNSNNYNNGIDTLKSIASSSVTSSKAGAGALKNAPQPSRTSTPPYVIDLLSRGNKKREATTTLTRSLKPGSANASVSSSQHGGGASQSHSHHRHHEEANKRFKHTETLYNASNVKADLMRGGLTYPELSTLRPRILLDRVNLTNVVELVSAKDFDRVQSQKEEPGNEEPTKDHKDKSAAAGTATKPSPLLDDAAEATLVNLIQECRSFYRLARVTNHHDHTPQTTTPNAAAAVEAEAAKRVDTASPDIDSSTSSMTDTESEENQNGMMEPSNDNEVTRRPNYITMGEALSITSQPRYVHDT